MVEGGGTELHTLGFRLVIGRVEQVGPYSEKDLIWRVWLHAC
jgi:hypothetical protein